MRNVIFSDSICKVFKDVPSEQPLIAKLKAQFWIFHFQASNRKFCVIKCWVNCSHLNNTFSRDFSFFGFIFCFHFHFPRSVLALCSGRCNCRVQQCRCLLSRRATDICWGSLGRSPCSACRWCCLSWRPKRICFRFRTAFEFVTTAYGSPRPRMCSTLCFSSDRWSTGELGWWWRTRRQALNW